MKTNILGVSFDVVEMGEVVSRILEHIENDKQYFVVTANPEIVMLAQNDYEFKKTINDADLVVPDGVGIVLASKFNKVKIHDRVAGYDLVQNLFSAIKDKDIKVYFLGSTQQAIEQAKVNMQKKYIGLNVCSCHDGYFDNDDIIIEQINSFAPDILLVGMGAPKQEKWIYRYKDKIDAKIFIGVGGSFDVMSGNIKRAPILMQKLGLEWFYRLVKQPKRIFRMSSLPKFIIKVVFRSMSFKDMG